MQRYCEDCAHVVDRKGPSRTWLCIKFPCPGGEGFVTKHLWERDDPYRRCLEINRHGACPLFEEKRNADPSGS